jgi:hypothetical protein
MPPTRPFFLRKAGNSRTRGNSRFSLGNENKKKKRSQDIFAGVALAHAKECGREIAVLRLSATKS